MNTLLFLTPVVSGVLLKSSEWDAPARLNLSEKGAQSYINVDEDSYFKAEYKMSYKNTPDCPVTRDDDDNCQSDLSEDSDLDTVLEYTDLDPLLEADTILQVIDDLEHEESILDPDLDSTSS